MKKKFFFTFFMKSNEKLKFNFRIFPQRTTHKSKENSKDTTTITENEKKKQNESEMPHIRANRMW